MNPTLFYTVPTLPPSPTLLSLALPALFVEMISVPGPHTPHSNKLQFSLGPVPLNSSANRTKFWSRTHSFNFWCLRGFNG